MNNLFTIKSLFGTSLSDFLERNLGSNAYITKRELENTKINFQKVTRYFLQILRNYNFNLELFQDFATAFENEI